MKVFLQLLGWLSAGLSLFLAMVLLELHWNLVNWKPVVDWVFLLLLLMIAGSLAGFERLARMPRLNPVTVVSVVVCLCLFGLGLYLLPQEALTRGLFERNQASPAWYRFGRLLILATPAAFSFRRSLGNKKRTPDGLGCG